MEFLYDSDIKLWSRKPNDSQLYRWRIHNCIIEIPLEKNHVCEDVCFHRDLIPFKAHGGKNILIWNMETGKWMVGPAALLDRVYREWMNLFLLESQAQELRTQAHEIQCLKMRLATLELKMTEYVKDRSKN
jgi:hypothetical protein